MDVQLKKGILELVILKFLTDHDYYGYELNKEINEILELNESTVYVILKKMIQNEMCISYTKDSENGPPRKYYQITNYGIQYLNEMILEWEDFTDKITKLLNERKNK